MDEALAAFDQEWKQGDRTRAREMARAYVAANREAIAPILTQRTLEDIVAMVTAYRQAGREEDRIIADMWLLVEYEPQRICGAITIGPTVAAAEAIIRGGK